MPSRDPLLRVQDILEAISRIQRYTAGMSLETFSADDKTIDAVIRNFIIIGEAAGQVGAGLQDRYPAVPWAIMRGMRNTLTHVYFGVSMSIVWQTIADDLPPLDPLLRDLLDRERSPD